MNVLCPIPLYCMAASTRSSFSNGLTEVVWVQEGGVVGRGVLPDWANWGFENDISLSPFNTGEVEPWPLKHIVKEQEIQFRRGDILFI
jgi:hypothetical protein